MDSTSPSSGEQERRATRVVVVREEEEEDRDLPRLRGSALPLLFLISLVLVLVDRRILRTIVGG